jgi:transposase
VSASISGAARTKKLTLEQIQLVQRLLDKGKSVRELAKTFDVHIATIYRLIET